MIVGVHPALPTEGITLTLGNGVSGGSVWADEQPPPPVVSSVPLVSSRPDDSEVTFPDVLMACVVTRAMTLLNSGKCGRTVCVFFG